MDNKLEQAIDNAERLEQKFNKVVHEADEHGDLIRNEDGTIRLKKQWKTEAVDRQGRKHNPKVHGDKPTLDSDGFLQVKRRRESKPITSTNRTEAFVNKYKEDGYAYYVMNEDGGRMEQFTQNEWEPVVTKDGQATMNVGQARSPNTRAVLMKKPLEWHEADQEKKVAIVNEDLKSKIAPKEDEGQYRATEDSPLR